MIFTALGWVIALTLAAMAAWRLSRIVLVRRHPHTGKRLWRDAFCAPNWYALALWCAPAVAAFTLLGVFAPLTGWVLAGIAVVIAAAGFRIWTPQGRFSLRAHLGGAFGEAWGDVLRSGGQMRGGEAPAGEAEAVVAEAVTSRNIPPVREDPALGLPPEPEVIASVSPPPPYVALAQFIAGFEPEDDQALTMFMQGNASGGLVIADAWRHFADVCLGSVGLDPAYVAGILEVGDTEGESAAHKAQVHKRFGVIYQQVQEWISAGRMLPHKAREFLTGEL